jgi:hypothetical protein
LESQQGASFVCFLELSATIFPHLHPLFTPHNNNNNNNMMMILAMMMIAGAAPAPAPTSSTTTASPTSPSLTDDDNDDDLFPTAPSLTAAMIRTASYKELQRLAKAHNKPANVSARVIKRSLLALIEPPLAEARATVGAERNQILDDMHTAAELQDSPSSEPEPNHSQPSPHSIERHRRRDAARQSLQAAIRRSPRLNPPVSTRQTPASEDELCRLAHVMADPELALIRGRIFDAESQATLDASLRSPWEDIAAAFNDLDNVYLHPTNNDSAWDDPDRDIAHIDPNPPNSNPPRTGTYLAEKWRNMRQWFTAPYGRWEASGQMDGSSPIQDFIHWEDGASKTPHPIVVIYSSTCTKTSPTCCQSQARRSLALPPSSHRRRPAPLCVRGPAGSVELSDQTGPGGNRLRQR